MRPISDSSVTYRIQTDPRVQKKNNNVPRNTQRGKHGSQATEVGVYRLI